MLYKTSLLLGCLATVIAPTLSGAVPPPTHTTPVQLEVPSSVAVNPTIMGKIDKPPSVSCSELTVQLTEHPPGGFPLSGSTAVLTNPTRTSCTYKVQVPQQLLGKKVYLWGDLKKPSPLVTVKPVGWNNPLPLPQQLGVVQNFNFVVQEAVMH